MDVKIFSIKYNKEKEYFDDSELRVFLKNNDIKEIHTKFINIDVPIWTYSVVFNDKSNKKDPTLNLNEKDRNLYEKIKLWRNEEAAKKKFPPYLIATNKQLEQLAIKKPATLEEFKLIDGLGSKKAKEYGKEIIEILKEEHNER